MTMKHSHVRQELVKSLRKAVAEEFREYCEDTTDSTPVEHCCERDHEAFPRPPRTRQIFAEGSDRRVQGVLRRHRRFNVYKKSSPGDLAVFSNRILAHEVEIWCPVWMACLKGACNVKRLAEENGKAINEGLPGVLGNKGTKEKYRREQGNMTPVLGNAGT